MYRTKNSLIATAYLVLFCIPAMFGQERIDTLGSKNAVRSDNSDNTPGVQIIYQCQVHPQVLSNLAGTCPRCGLQLKSLSIEEAFANLSKKGYKKPELSPHFLTKTVVEEGAVTDDSSEVSDTAFVAVNLDEYDFETIDHDGDGMLFQCPNDPLEFEDEDGNCLVCGTPYEYLTVDQVKANLLKIKKIKKPEEENEESTASNNP
jgi:hypothetical protein